MWSRVAERLAETKRGILFILSAPAGTGKTTLVTKLTGEFAQIKESVSTTTRAPRAGEVEGQHYHFVSPETFEEEVAAGKFLEHAQVFSNHYGTSQESVDAQRDAGTHVFLVIDTQGALQVKERLPEARLIFLSPPSLDELRRRLEKRKTESPEAIEERLAWAQEEIDRSEHYHYLVVNEELETAYEVLRSIVIAETHRVALKN